MPLNLKDINKDGSISKSGHSRESGASGKSLFGGSSSKKWSNDAYILKQKLNENLQQHQVDLQKNGRYLQEHALNMQLLSELQTGLYKDLQFQQNNLEGQQTHLEEHQSKLQKHHRHLEKQHDRLTQILKKNQLKS